MTLGANFIKYIAFRKDINTWSSTKSEIIGANNTFTMIIWTILFLESWGYDIDKNIFYQENNYTILI